MNKGMIMEDYVICKDIDGTDIRAGETFHIIGSGCFNPLSECEFWWDPGLMRFQIRVRVINPGWANDGSKIHSIGQPWGYVDEMIQKAA